VVEVIMSLKLLNDGVVKMTLELLAVRNQFYLNVSSLDDSTAVCCA